MYRRLARLALLAMLLGGLLGGWAASRPAPARADDDTWATRRALVTPAYGAGVAVDQFGVVYAAGGINASGYLTTLESYDPHADAWSIRAPMPTPRARFGAATGLDGKVYAIGSLSAALADLTPNEVYDPRANTWASLAPMPTARDSFGLAAAANGKLYAIGGKGSGRILDTVEEYDPTTNSWTPRAPLATPRYALAVAAARNGRVYAVGGASPTTVLGTLEEYDPAADVWRARDPMPTPRAALGLIAASNGKLYAIGGLDGAGNPVASVEEYDPAANAWTHCQPSAACTPLPAPRTVRGRWFPRHRSSRPGWRRGGVHAAGRAGELRATPAGRRDGRPERRGSAPGHGERPGQREHAAQCAEFHPGHWRDRRYGDRCDQFPGQRASHHSAGPQHE